MKIGGRMNIKIILVTTIIFSLFLTTNLWGQKDNNQTLDKVIEKSTWGNLWTQENNNSALWKQENDYPISTLAGWASGSKKIKFSGYGGPEVRATSFADKWGVLIGGRGGLLINRNFTVGLMGGVFADNAERNYRNETIEINMVYGGTYLEYTWGLPKIVHFSIPIDLVAMEVKVKKMGSSDDTLNLGSNSDAMFGVIPRFNVEFNISSFFIISLTGGYRFALGRDNDYLNDYDAWGPEAGVFFKFGKF